VTAARACVALIRKGAVSRKRIVDISKRIFVRHDIAS
jgi:hypothetical protein